MVLTTLLPKRPKGFTLAEVLISLAILGVIATFTIPKVLQSNQDQTWNATAKEAAAAFSSALYNYRNAGNSVDANTGITSITPYLNYVAIDTSGSLIDQVPGLTSLTCNASYPCYRLHNGAVMMFNQVNTFGNTNTTNYIFSWFDPDGKYSGSTTGPGKTLGLMVYFNGKTGTSDKRLITDETNISGGIVHQGSDTKPDWWNSWQ
jgi:prepilin-type N-terminal cleavage/methylation domain-containing protein